MTDAIGPSTDRFLLAIGAIAILLVTGAFLLPATVDVPAASGSGPSVDLQGAQDGAASGNGDAEPVEGGVANGSGSGSGSGDLAPLELSVNASQTDDYLVPGKSFELVVTRADEPVEGATISVAGEDVGETSSEGGTRVAVPGRDEIDVAATASNGDTVEQTLDVADDLTLRVGDPVSRSEGALVHAGVAVDGEYYNVSDATVTVDGTQVGETDEGGLATVSVPEGADELPLGVQYDELEATETVPLDLEAGVQAFYPLAASPVEATGSYGEYGADAEVYVVSGDASDRADAVVEDANATAALVEGSRHVRLPASSTATVIVTDGHETETVTLNGLLQNLAIGVVLSLCLVGGMTVTTLRVLRWLDFDVGESGHAGGSLADLIASIGAGLLGVADGLAALAARIRLPRIPAPSLPSVPVPSLSAVRLPRLSLGAVLAPARLLAGLRLPSFRIPSLGVPSVGLPGLPSLGRPTLDDEEDAGGDEPAPAVVDPFDPASDDADDTPQLSERELVRAAVRDLGRLAGVSRIETNTPGQIGRRALDRALPREPVSAIVDTVREVEYGGGEATSEHASRVRDAVRRLRDAVAEARDGGDEPDAATDGGFRGGDGR